ncbi:MAG: RnfABCDGE type electron transport complex subunit B [Gammaproteobacteria bacterium]
MLGDGRIPYQPGAGRSHEKRFDPRSLKSTVARAANTKLDLVDLARRSPQVAVIDEAACIGCTKCIAACPFDAILGASKQMHTVLAELCTGCELCVAPCPVDCIALRTQDPTLRPSDWLQQALDRYRSRKHRLRRQYEESQRETASSKRRNVSRDKMRKEIAAAVERARAKRWSSKDTRVGLRGPKDPRP